MSTRTASAIPTSLTNSGTGIVWANPANAALTGIGTALAVVMQSFSISSNVLSVSTNPNAFVSGQTVTISGMFFGTYLNGVTVTVLSSGLSSSGFSANFTHADVSSTFDVGLVTPTTAYTTATNFSYVTLSAGQHALYMTPKDGPLGQSFSGSEFGDLPASLAAMTRGTGGVNGQSLAPTSAGSASYPLPIPTLPAGSTVIGIQPYATGAITATGGGAFLNFQVTGTGVTGSFTLNGSPSILPSIGTNLSAIPSIVFTNQGESTLDTRTGYSFANAISDYGVVVVYTTTGTPIPPTQLQTLVATSFGYSVAPNAYVTGIQLNLGSGIVTGSSTVSLTAQLTLGGTPVGTTKTLTALSGWQTPYSLGSSADVWGTTLRGSNINGSSGLGVNITGTLPSGNQINLNGMSLVVTYSTPATVAHITIGNTRPPTVGFN